MPDQGACPALCVVGGLWVTVVDASSGAIVANASVSVAGPGCADGGCSCQPGGSPERQFLCAVPDGTYTVTAQASGYATGSATATIASSGPPLCRCQVATRVTVPLSR